MFHNISRPLVMGILNVTPDSFSDGGEFFAADAAVRRAERMIGEGADIIDIGGESTRPGSTRISAEEEIRRVVPVIEAVAAAFDVPISIDTTKSEVANAAAAAGAKIINDISGLRWDRGLADVAASANAGLILMHSRGTFEKMHTEPPAENIFADISSAFTNALNIADAAGVAKENIALDIGIGFGKTFEQNLELLAKLDKIIAEFENYPMVVGVSRKSFIGKILDEPEPQKRVAASVAAAVFAITKGASILRVHDVKETADALKIVATINEKGS
jgi:dihydropteroate synthase